MIPEPLEWRLPDGGTLEVFPAAPLEAVRQATRELAVEGLVMLRRYTTEGRVVELEGDDALRTMGDPANWALETGRDSFVELLTTAKRRGDLRRDVRAVRWVRAKRQMGQLMGRKD